MMVERQTIPHLNALVDGSKILGEQLCSFLRGCHATSSLKSVFFTRKVAWSSLIELHGCSWNILEPTSRGLKWGIICLCSISGFLSNPLFTKYSNPLVKYFQLVVYTVVWISCGNTNSQKYWYLGYLDQTFRLNWTCIIQSATAIWKTQLMHMGSCTYRTMCW